MAAETVIGDLFVRVGMDLTEMNKGFSSAENRLEKFGTQMFFLGSRITAGVTLPFTAAMGAVGKWTVEFDQAMTESLAIMDHVGPGVRAQLEASAKSVTDFTKFSAVEGAKGFYSLASAGLDAQTQIGALPVVARFAQAGLMDLAKSAEFLAGAQAAMATGTESSSEKVDQMARIADVLTMANNRALGTIQDFAEALTNKAGAALRLYHKDVEEGVAVLAVYAEQNLKGKAAGQALMMTMRDLGTQALKHADAFQKFGIAVYDAQGNMKNMADIIGDIEKATRGMSDAQIQQMLIELGIPQRSVNTTKALIGYSEAIRDHEKALRSAGGTAQQVADEQMKSLSNQLLQLWNQFKVASTEIGESFRPVFEQYVMPILKSALAQFKEFGKFIEGLPTPVKAFGLAIVGAVVAAGPLIATLGSFSLLAASAMRGISAMAGVIGDWMVAAGLASGSAKALNIVWGETYTAAIAAANAEGVFGEAAVASSIAAADQAKAMAALKTALPLSEMALLAGVVTGVAAAIYEIHKETGNWRDTLIAIAVPFGGTLTLLESFLNWLGLDTQALRDLGAIMRDVVIISFQEGEKVIKNWAVATMGFIGGVYEYAKDKLSWLLDMMGKGMPEGMRIVLDRMRQIADQAPAMADAIAKSMHEARAAMDRVAGIKDTGGVSPTHSQETFGVPIPGGPKPAPKTGGGMPDVPPDKAKRVSDFQKMLEEIGGDKLQHDIATTAAVFGALVNQGKDVDPAVHERMWEAYKKLRGETDALVPAFGQLFKAEIDNYNEMQRMKLLTGEWGDLALTAETKAVQGMKGVGFAYATVFYDSSKAMQNMSDMVGQSQAKLEDMETQLDRFTETSGTLHRNALKSNLAKIEQDQNEHYRKALQGLAHVDGQQYDEYVRYLNKLKASDAEYLRVYELVESAKFAASLGVDENILRHWKQMSKAQRDEIIETQIAWNKFVYDIEKTVGTIGALGDLFTTVGGPTNELGNALKFAAQNMENFLKAGQDIMKGNIAKGLIETATATAQAVQTMMDTGSRAGRMAIGAETGFMLGGPIGAFIGGIAGAFMKDPAWKKVQDSVDSMWDVSVSKELAKAIAADEKNMGGRINAELLHLNDIITAGGGLTAQNVNQWAGRLSDVFNRLAQGQISSANAGKVLDASFADIVKSGTATNGLVSEQISKMVELERVYQTGSAAIKAFSDTQLKMVAEGFNKVVAGVFGPLTTAQDTIDQLEQDQQNISDKILKLKAKIADYEKDGVKNEKQRVDLFLTRVQLAKQERLLTESQAKESALTNQISAFFNDINVQMGDKMLTILGQGQDKFDRMGRLALVTFNAMISSGHTYREALDAIGDGLDILIEAQKDFGLSSSDAFQQLMHLREFATVHPEIMDELDGLTQMMTGLSNTSFLTSQTFNDLGDTAADVFNQMTANGMTTEEALALMHPQLQLLWELEKKYGFAVDDATQALLDQAEASGTVGEKYMSANDKMVLGIDHLNKMIEAFLKHLGIDIPAEAEAAAKGVNDAFDGVNPQVDVDIHYREHDKPNSGNGSGDGTDTPMASGGVLTRPTHVLAGEAGPEGIIPLDRLFDEINAMQAGSKDELQLTIMLDNDVLATKVVKNVPRILKLRGL